MNFPFQYLRKIVWFLNLECENTTLKCYTGCPQEIYYIYEGRIFLQ